METLRYRFPGQHDLTERDHHALVGVVASGNLEVPRWTVRWRSR
jgi:malonate decarboxylase delta subunit